MTNKHTPGPWVFDGDNGVMAEVGAHICTISMADDFPCVDDDESNARENVDIECNANARLIAAAPDLLDALKSAVDTMQYDGFDTSKLEAVIAKAEGRS